MSTDTSHIFDAALALPESLRAALAQQLLQSLEPGEPEPGYEEAWAAEIEARIASIEDGTAELVDWKESLARIRAVLDAKRSS